MGIFDGLPGLDTQKAEPKPSGIFDGLPGLDSPVAVMEEQTPAPVSQPAGVEASDEAVVPQSKSIFGRIAEIPENIRSFIPSIAEWKAFTGAYKTGELDKYMKPDDPRYAKSKIEHQQNGFSESVDAAKWALTYAMSLGGNIGPKGMKEELAKEAQSFTGLGSITIPSTTATATSALEWAYLYPAMFEAAGITTEAIKKLPLVQKALQAIEKSGGVQAIAEKFPRIYKGFISALESFEQGAMVGATKGTAEAVTQGMDIKEAAGHIAGEAAGFGLVSGAFSVASSVDKKMAADLLRKTMMQKMDSQLQGLIGQTTSPQQVKGLAGWRDNALRRIDDIVSAFEGDLYGMTEGNLYKNIGGGKIEDPRISAEKFLKYGYKPMSGGPAVQGVESLKTGIGQRKPGDIMTGVPTTRAGEVVEAVKHPIKTAQEQIRSLRESLPPPSAENVTLKGPVEPTPELARQIVQTSPDAAKAFADKPSPSRTDMESLGLPGSSAPIRKKLAEEIKVQLSTPVEEITIQPKGPEDEVIQEEMRRTEDQTIQEEDTSTVPPITWAVTEQAAHVLEQSGAVETTVKGGEIIQGRGGNELGAGSYFSTSKSQAESYAAGKGAIGIGTEKGGGIVIEKTINSSAKLFILDDTVNKELFDELMQNKDFAKVWKDNWDTEPTNNSLWGAAQEAHIGIQNILEKKGFQGAGHKNYITEDQPQGSMDYSIWDKSVLTDDPDGIKIYRGQSSPLQEQKGQEKRLTPDGKVKQTDVPSQEITKAPVESIQADPKRFQFKQDATEEGGVTQKLSSVEKWNEKAAGVVLVWEDNSGKRFVVDGHHRLALAKKLGVKNINVYVLKESEGVTDKDARAFGAMSNLADEKGTAVDAAKLFRDSDMSDADLKKEGVNIKSEIVKQGLAMKTLSDEVFRMVINGKVPANMAANIGKYVTDPVKQKAVADMIADGQVDTAREAELLAKTIDSAPVLRKEEQTLFGTDVTEKSLFAERAKVLANVEAILKTNKKVFGVLSTKSGIIEQAGNVLNKESNKAAKDKADEVLYLLEKMVNYKGPVAEALNEATKQYAENPTKAKLAEVSRELLDRWQKELTIENVGNVRQELPESKDEVKPKGGGDNLFSDYREPVKIEGYDESDQKPGTTVGMNSELYAGKGGETEVTNRPNSIVFGLKELVELTRSLLGDIPSVKKNLGAAAGRFYHKDDVGIGKILMSGNAAYGPKVSEGLTKKTGEDLANLIDGVVEKLSAKFAVKASDIKVEQTADGKKTLLKFYLRDPDYGAKVLAHEIGHASDWLPDNTLKRGNILGHVAALRNFTKSMIGESPEVVDDVLNDSDRKRLAKEARRIVKGTSPDNMKKGERNKIVADTLKDLVKQEAARRGIYTKAELNEELNKLSRWWKPIAGNASPEYVAYREKPAELYADAVSVLLNNPEALRKQAPKFYDAFFGYISSRPQAKEAYTALIDKIYAGTTRDEAIGRLLDGFRIGTEKHLKQLKQGAINRRDIWKNIRSLFYSKFAENYALARKARASGIIDADTDPVNRIGEARYTSNMIEGYMNELQTAVYNPIAKAGIPLEVFDLFLLGKRVIGEEGQKFAPEGMTDKDWTGYLSDLRVKYKEKYKILEDAHDKMWEIRKRDILDKIKENEFFDKETMDSLYDEPYYVRFDVVDYIDKKNGIGSGLKLFKRVGTFRQVAGPLESTILQDMGMLYSLNWNSAKKSVAELNVKLDKATEAEKTFDGKRWIFKEPTDKDLRLMMYMDKGEMKGFYVDKWQAAGFDTHDPLEYKAIANIANTIAGGQKVIYTALTPAFWLPNIIKDSARTLINVPGANPINLAINLIKNVPLAWKSEYGTDSPKILEMMKHGALLSRANITGLTSDEALAGQLLTMHTGRKLDRQGRINPVGYIERAWQFYKHLGQFTERASKIASWDLIRKKNPDMPLREVAQMVRTEAGSPDFAEKGRLTWAVNPLMLFVNPGVQGLTTDLRVATQKGRRGSFWMKMAAYQIAPKLIQWAIGAGVLVSILKALGVGDDDEPMVIAKEAQDIIKSQSEYVQTNYINIPIGKDENGKGIVLTIPMDHTGMALSGIMHNALNANAKGVGTALTNSVQYAIDQMPGGNQPIFTLAKWWKDYGRGVNPYDEYRGHTLIPKNEFEAKDLDPQHRAAKVLAKESLAQLGAGGFIKFNTGDPGRIKSTLEKLTYTPGIGPVISRFIRVSDYGVRQQLQEATGGVKSESAMNRLNIRDATVKSMRGEPLTQDEEQLLKENQSYSKQFADSKAVREQGDAISQSIAAALTKDERVAMYRKLREIKGSDFNLKPYAEKDIATSTLQMTDPASDRRKGEKLEDFKIRQANRKKDIAESIELLKFLGVTEKEALEALRASAKSRGYKTDIYTNGKITAYGERVRAVKKNLE
jgi:hypothetical protein